ncbi:pyridoxamine 5'-phosphate oxidase family protein [Rhodoblastus acidophilus]|uniref:Pyridoxamine 5'-phosphate oxidase family protein n=1 Tax=Candidatus Rhodoblastus alkanivorans TaxID=2954117 RepID=A0ABS9Z8P7_9HYPH|nr:pyridoxamine 5'-phosphate oxidase family protein [Candidatus Rhodoblastus alkanivorans]MCI4680549.1 pyridoxamine 5'-phosphate oxidase family protein [Candidatus Rhodoblastus alkanivorans]MCI4683988.1 pyridoxamine 5'-phosphate oxidase family protein [Candidatus Rhodoblastus alkanivorans]MDI4641307.1 pyridoxamine 5'-phosphate oxidase family protein [Rhodoblastus acidophilus]
MTDALPDRRPWSEGEAKAQGLAGAAAPPALIRTFATEQHREFFPRLPMLFVAGLDASGAPVASLLRGAPGFLSLPEPRRLEIAAAFPEGDAMTREKGAPFGAIGVEFATRRRNRINGRILAASADRMTVAVEEAFGNCPKYIVPRALLLGDAGAWTDLPAFDAQAQAMIAGATVFFVATRGPDGVDMSHRGGPPGFVRIETNGALRIPDFPGNRFFNTFGNLLADPRAALLFLDFPAGRALQLTGAARVEFTGEERFWTFTPRAARLLSAEPFGT